VDDYLSDKEQLERLRQWWRENGWFLLGGLALGLLAIYGYNQYYEYKDRRSEAAYSIYDEIGREIEAGNVAGAETRFAAMRGEYPDHVYTLQAALLVASAQVVTAPDSAIEKLRYVMDESADPELAMVARLRLARVLSYRERHREALALLDVPRPGQFAGRIAEIRGDIHAALGETDAARSAYLEAMVASGAELLDRSFVQMKLADLPGASVGPTSTRLPAEPAQDISGDAAEAPAGGAADARDAGDDPALPAEPADEAPAAGAAPGTAGEGA
jgi:predicted negative regulator of RcsB-dependent stress response